MNIAVSSIIIFLLLLPGIIFRRFYFTEEFSKQYFKLNFFELFISSVIPSVVIHFILSAMASFIGSQIDIEILGQLLTSRDYPKQAFENIQNNISNISTYYITSLVIGIVFGYLSKKVIRKFNLDSNRKIFRFKTHGIISFLASFLTSQEPRLI